MVPSVWVLNKLYFGFAIDPKGTSVPFLFVCQNPVVITVGNLFRLA
jgi:hypothetical protein